MNVRQAILKAANLIENKPGMWDFGQCVVPPCGSPGCALGWIGAFMGVGARTDVGQVSYAVLGLDAGAFYGRMSDINCALQDWFDKPSWHVSAETAATCLRLYADRYHPAHSGLPDIVRDIFQPKRVAA